MSDQSTAATELLANYLDKLTAHLDEMAARLHERRASGAAITADETGQMAAWCNGIAGSVRLTRLVLGPVAPLDPELPPNVVRLSRRPPAIRIMPAASPDGAA